MRRRQQETGAIATALQRFLPVPRIIASGRDRKSASDFVLADHGARRVAREKHDDDEGKPVHVRHTYVSYEGKARSWRRNNQFTDGACLCEAMRGAATGQGAETCPEPHCSRSRRLSLQRHSFSPRLMRPGRGLSGPHRDADHSLSGRRRRRHRRPRHRAKAHDGARPAGHRREPPRRRLGDRHARRGEGRAGRLHAADADHRHEPVGQSGLRRRQGFRADRHDRLDPDRGDGQSVGAGEVDHAT